MPDLYLIIVLVLFALAITDLIVGVSNDAVNFLNSAIGSQVAPRYVIMVVASLGIFVGATFSSGMMEIARKGIFNPEQFVFAEVMVIFVAVMLTDIILLDLFNTFGLPTSTTVSIVFELLGAATMVAMIKIMGSEAGLSTLSLYINSASALAIISGIFLSVGIAFTIGGIVQYFSRILFSFYYEKRLSWIGSLWSGFALSILTYFLLIKGAKGASFVSKELLDWFAQHTIWIISGSFLGWSLVLQFLHTVFKVNILRIVVLFGTFALAMAFAGNDLVNFIGVPIAGLESFLAWQDSGIAPDQFNMASLAEPVRTQVGLLLGAGLIMVLTLWFSKKARSVTETEVNLGRQGEGLERFSEHPVSQFLVRLAYVGGKAFRTILPDKYFEWTEPNFKPAKRKRKDPSHLHPPAFDLVRASVNLTVASMLISLATSLQLPLSTTYVSFMVAMGTSLADRAWGRDSAVFRVTGVLSVIAGWFATALIAFTVAGLFALLIYHFEIWAIILLLALGIGLILRSFAYHRSKEKLKQALRTARHNEEALSVREVEAQTSLKIAESLSDIRKAYSHALVGLLQEDKQSIKRAKKAIAQLRKQNEDLRLNMVSDIRRIDEHGTRGSRLYLLVFDLEEDILQSVFSIVKACKRHVENVHTPLLASQNDQLQGMLANVSSFLKTATHLIREQDISQAQQLLINKTHILQKLESYLSQQVVGVKSGEFSARNSQLYFTILLETKDLVAVTARFVKLYYRAYLPEEQSGLLYKEGGIEP